MTFNENPFDLPSVAEARRTDSGGLDLLADVIDNKSPVPGIATRSNSETDRKHADDPPMAPF